MTYWHWLLGISIAFAVAERARPARPRQAVLRRQLANDLAYNAFNGHVWALLTGATTGAIASGTRSVLARIGVLPEETLLFGWSFAAQFAVYLVASDFLQWCVHNLLHRVPLLWQFHKVHHSIHDMDWAGNFRFHWVELVVYRSLLYVPLLFLGGDPEPLFAVAVFATAWGHFNHSNIDIGIGALGFVFNSPRMHLWHHDASDEGGIAKNFGVVFSLWDWLFRTAYWPSDRAPQRLGFPADGEMPNDLARQALFPLSTLVVRSSPS